MIVRFAMAVIAIVSRWGLPRSWSFHEFDLILPLDLALTLALFLTGLGLSLLLALNRRRRRSQRVETNRAPGISTAAAALMVTWILTQTIPQALISRMDHKAPLDASGSPREKPLIEEEYEIRASYFLTRMGIIQKGGAIDFDRDDQAPKNGVYRSAKTGRLYFPPQWFYAANTFSGFSQILVLFLTLLLVALEGLRRARRWIDRQFGGYRESPCQDERRGGVLHQCLFVALFILVPVTLWVSVMGVCLGAFHVPFFVFASGNMDASNEPIYRAVVIFSSIVISVLFPLNLIMFSSELRSMFFPVMELAQDVGNYFPRVRGVDQTVLGRAFFGDREECGGSSLAAVLDDRLRSLLTFVHRRHGAPTPVVGHSLGTVIALSALERWAPISPRESDSPVPATTPPPEGFAADLVTLACPLRRIWERYPQFVSHEGSEVRPPSLPTLRRWMNWNREDEPIGSRFALKTVDFGMNTSWNQAGPIPVTDFGATPSTFVDGPKADPTHRYLGGHSGYFEDDEVAMAVARWLCLTSRPVSSGPEPRNGGQEA
ncbi:hypothetical protein P12x_006185 (plasmid) [Tundrisphaera lichenicola]|uniref:hypothetical protein n=1 Tax=Tundrisphaera lichenicola TaxID=2029860 RepID=UPI003EBBF3B8